MFILEDPHAGDEQTDFWTEVWSITFDPAHMVAEVVSAIIIDVVVIALMYNIVFKKFILPRMRKTLREEIHHDIDVEHGYNHDNHGRSSSLEGR
jgi:hypothetical protein